MKSRLELGQEAFSAGFAMLDEIGPGLIGWAASHYAAQPPWWPELAPLKQAERAQVWAQLAMEAAERVQSVETARGTQ